MTYPTTLAALSEEFGAYKYIDFQDGASHATAATGGLVCLVTALLAAFV